MKRSLACTLLPAILLAASCARGPAAEVAAAQTARGNGNATTPCAPVEQRDPNASQQPTFAGQTRACADPSNVAFEVVVLTGGLEHPWAVEPLPTGDLLVTERGGTMRIVTAGGVKGPAISGVPEVDSGGQGGLLDVALSPSFVRDRVIYWSFVENRQSGNATSVARGILSPDGRRLDQVQIIFRALPPHRGRAHFGSRLVFGPDGMLYVTLGDRSDRDMRPHAQQTDSHMGKVLRIRPDGGVPSDNPFAGRAGSLPEIWTLGHRNVQSAAFDGSGQLWIVEHGARGGDELNRLEKGKNYGWPLVTFGEEYSGLGISGSVTTKAGFVDPVYYWDPVIAPSGAEFYSGDAFPAWKGSLFIGALKEERLVRLVIENGRVKGEEHLLVDRGQRIRDVRQGPDGSLYLVTDESDGELWKIVAKR